VVMNYEYSVVHVNILTTVPLKVNELNKSEAAENRPTSQQQFVPSGGQTFEQLYFTESRRCGLFYGCF